MSKIAIYQVLPRHFGNFKKKQAFNGSIDENGCGKMNYFTPKALQEIKDLGITHIWFTGIIEHSTKTDYTRFSIKRDHAEIVKGNAGSPYAIKDYYDIDPDLAENVAERMQEFESLVERTHNESLKVIIDFVPNHVAREYFSDAKPSGVEDLGEKDNSDWHFSPLNNFYYIPNHKFSPQFYIDGYHEYPAKATGNDVFSSHPSINDWYETIKLNYGVNYVEGHQKQFDPIPNTWLKMRDILNFWASKKVDGFRCDMAEMVPVEFWEWVIPQVKKNFPAVIFIAEVYNPHQYRNYIFQGHFDYLYDKVGLYDKLRDITCGNGHAHDITYFWQVLSGIEDKMLNFMENHDEQRIASDFFCGDGSKAIPAMIVSATLARGPVMIYSGQELGERGMEHEGYSGVDGRTSIFDYCSVKSIQAWVNEGKFDGKELSSEQKSLREFYKRLLNACLEEKAISMGLMYDLEYINFNNPYFNTLNQYAYVRKYEDDVLLIVVNFHETSTQIKIQFPEHMFRFLEMDETMEYTCVDILDSMKKYDNVHLSSSQQLNVALDPWNGKIFKLSKLIDVVKSKN